MTTGEPIRSFFYSRLFFPPSIRFLFSGALSRPGGESAVNKASHLKRSNLIKAFGTFGSLRLRILICTALSRSNLRRTTVTGCISWRKGDDGDGKAGEPAPYLFLLLLLLPVPPSLSVSLLFSFSGSFSRDSITKIQNRFFWGDISPPSAGIVYRNPVPFWQLELKN